MQKVEQVVEDRNAATQRLGRIGYLHPWLQSGETGAAALERDDLPVHHRVTRQVIGDGLDQLGIGSIQALAVP